MRLNKFLAQAGVCSRRQADTLIQSGQVKVNDKAIREMGSLIDPEKDVVSVNGKTVAMTEKTMVYLFNKPRGVVTTTDDPQGKKTVLDFFPKSPRLFPCGRLDEDTQGLVVLTNDGDLCYQLTHPKFEHQKEYVVRGKTNQPELAFKKLAKGLVLNDKPVQIDALELHRISNDRIEFSITIHEGRTRIVRRLSATVGIEITTLTRVRVGEYELGDLEPGQYKLV